MDLITACDIRLASNSPLVSRGSRRSWPPTRTVDQALDLAAQWNASYLISNDLIEAVAAFMEKRDPECKGN